MVKAAILGAGPAGLCAALRLARQGIRVEVIEAESQVGGLCRTIQHVPEGPSRGDFFFDLGGHRFATKNKELEKEVKQLQGSEIVSTTRCSTIRLNGKDINYPLEMADLLKKMDIFTSIKCGLDYIKTILRRTVPQDITFEDWVINRFGKALYSIYFGPYSTKLWGVSPDLISADWAEYRITLTSLWDVALRLLKIKKDTPTTYIRNFYYPASGGIGRISECISKEIQANGGIIHLNSTVEELQVDKNKVICLKDGIPSSIEYDFVISTISLPELIHKISPMPSDEYLEAASSLRFRGIRFFNLCINKERVSEKTWMYIPQKDILFFRIQEPKNWAESNTPTDKTSLILEIACNKGDDVWNADDKSIYPLCIDGLKKIGFDLEKEIIDCFSVRVECAYPIYSLDYKAHTGKLFEFLDKYKNVVCCGRQGLFWYNAMDEAMLSGFKAADKILEQQGKDCG